MVKARDGQQRGFTLVETLVVCTLLPVVLLTLFALYRYGYENWVRAENGIDLHQNVALALDAMVRDLRRACGVAAASTPTAVVFLLDADGDGMPDRTCRYRLAQSRPDELIRQERQGGRWVGNNPVADNLKEVGFTYYRRGDRAHPVADPDETSAPTIGRIAIRVVAEKNVGGQTLRVAAATAVVMRAVPGP